jgi:hypothetical protein
MNRRILLLVVGLDLLVVGLDLLVVGLDESPGVGA